MGGELSFFLCIPAEYMVVLPKKEGVRKKKGRRRESVGGSGFTNTLKGMDCAIALSLTDRVGLVI